MKQLWGSSQHYVTSWLGVYRLMKIASYEGIDWRPSHMLAQSFSKGDVWVTAQCSLDNLTKAVLSRTTCCRASQDFKHRLDIRLSRDVAKICRSPTLSIKMSTKAQEGLQFLKYKSFRKVKWRCIITHTLDQQKLCLYVIWLGSLTSKPNNLVNFQTISKFAKAFGCHSTPTLSPLRLNTFLLLSWPQLHNLRPFYPCPHQTSPWRSLSMLTGPS